MIGETLDSILAQTYIHWECIVVDDGSTDTTDEVLKKYEKSDPRFRFYHRPVDSPKGANTCRNYGFEVSKGEFINWFDDDDVMLPDFLKVKKDKFTESLDFVISSGYYVDSDLKKRKEMKIFQTEFLYRDYLKWDLELITNSVLFKKSYLIGKELFSNKIKRGQETELFLRLFYKVSKTNYCILEEYVFLYRQHEHTKTFKNAQYVNHYKESLAYIYIENLKRSVALNDLELINYLYQLLILMFLDGFRKNHFTLVRNVCEQLSKILFPFNKKTSLRILLYGYFLLFFKRRRRNIEQQLLKTKI